MRIDNALHSSGPDFVVSSFAFSVEVLNAPLCAAEKWIPNACPPIIRGGSGFTAGEHDEMKSDKPFACKLATVVERCRRIDSLPTYRRRRPRSA